MTIPDSDLNEYKGTVLKRIAKSYTNLVVDYRVTELFGDKDTPCSVDVKDSLESFKFEANSKLLKVQSYAFYKCTALKEIDFSNCFELSAINEYAFAECTSIEKVTLPTNELLSIQQYAFYSCISLKQIFIPKNVKSLGKAIFFSCSTLSGLSIEKDCSLTTIPYWFFRDSSISSFRIPKEITQIANGAFEFASKLSSLTVEDGNTKFKECEGGIMNQEGTIFVCYPQGRTGSITIPSGTISIDSVAFACAAITHVSFPDTLTTIGNYAFQLSSLTEVIIPDSVTYIGVYAFNYCRSLTSLKLSSKCPAINSYCFSNCNLTSVAIPEGVTELKSSCFAGNNILINIELPSTITTIGGNIFPSNKNLEISFGENQYIKIEDCMLMDMDETFISQYTGSASNAKISIPSNVKVIKERAFYNKGNIIEVSFPDDSMLTSIEAEAFSYCYNLSDFTFPEMLTSIGKDAFTSCNKLQTVEFGSNLNSFGEGSFSSCKGLRSVHLTNSKVKKITKNLFYECSELESVYISPVIASFNDYCFYNCTKLSNIVFPEYINNIGEYSFYNTAITSFELKQTCTITSISRNAFAHCTKLTTVEFCPSLNHLGVKAFSSSGVEHLILTSNIETINDRCFQDCKSLSSVSIPADSLLEESELGLGIFDGCTSLASISCSSSHFCVSIGALFSLDMKRLLIFPPASNIIYLPIPETVTSIGNGAFLGCTKIHSIIIPSNSVRSIGEMAFEGCTNLRYINIPSTVEIIGSGAFAGCKSLICGVDIESKDLTFISKVINEGKLHSYALRKCSDLSCKVARSNRKNRFSNIVVNFS